MRKAGSMMTVRPRLRRAKADLILAAATALAHRHGALRGGLAAPAGAAASLPCDIYATAGTPCVAAHSTIRALFASYNGPLYQVRRASDGATTNIGTLSAGGYANAAAQDSFCAGTTARSPRSSTSHRSTTTSRSARPAGPAAPDVGANAAALPVTAGGHKVYGVYVSPGHRIPRRRHHGGGDRIRAAGRLHGHQRHSRQQRLLLRLRQRRDQQPRQRQRAHGRGLLRHLVLVRDVHRSGPVGAGRPGERPVRRRQRQQPEQRGQQQHVRHRPGQEQRHDDVRDQGRQRRLRRPDHLVQRVAAHHERVQPDAPGGRHHPRDRRRQQQQLRRARSSRA